MDPEIITETPEYFILNKPAGMATEPPSREPTLCDYLVESGHIKAGEWGKDDRYGIVHRLDADTSGVVIWAKNPSAQQKLREWWQGRQVKKTYLALVAGSTEPSGVIELPIMRDNRNDKQTIAWLPNKKARPAITQWRRIASQDFEGYKISLVEAHPVTGRTHQIRIHFKAIGHPLVGDELYGEKSTQELAAKLNLDRHFLHAKELCLPDNSCYQAPLPPDLSLALDRLNLTPD